MVSASTDRWMPPPAAAPSPVAASTVDFDEVLRRRRMVRHFTDRPVDPQHVDALLAAALRAPSAGFTQGIRLLVLTEAADRRRLWAASDWVPADDGRARVAARLREAPVLVVPLCSEAAYRARYAEPDKTSAGGWSAPYWYVDAAFAAMLVLLKAVDLGLGALFMGTSPGWVGPFRDEFGVPAEWDPIGVVLVGHRHPEVGPAQRRDRRLPVEVMVHRGHWHGEVLPPRSCAPK